MKLVSYLSRNYKAKRKSRYTCTITAGWVFIQFKILQSTTIYNKITLTTA